MTGIRDVRRAYCPMGCGNTLHLMQSGVLMCLGRDCPRPDAAQSILEDPESEHVVEFTDQGWTAMHPLRERLDAGKLFVCLIAEACNRLPGPPGGINGKYRVRLNGDGGLEVELLEAAGSGTS